MDGDVRTLRELAELRERVWNLENRLDKLGSSVPPGSEPALRGKFVEQPPADAYEHHGLPIGHYWVWYEGDWITGNWDGEDWNLANGVTTTSRHVLRSLRISDPPVQLPDESALLTKEGPTRPSSAGGPPIPDLAAQPDSTLNNNPDNSLGSSVPPGSESALREEWRVGSKVPLNIYEGDRPVCQCHIEFDAQRIVRAMNRRHITGGPPTRA